MPGFQGLDKALRFIRLQRKRKQGDVAARAGITQAMLCSYEQGSRAPTLASLEKILAGLDSDLVELDRALHLVNGLPARAHAETTLALPPRSESSHGLDLETVLGLETRLPATESLALARMLDGFCDWLRLLVETRETSARGASRTPPGPSR